MKAGGDDALAERREVVFVGELDEQVNEIKHMLNAFIKTLAAG